MELHLTPLATTPRSLAHRDLPDSPHGDTVQRLLAVDAPDDWVPTEATCELYLSSMERLVRLAAPWQDAQGAIIDPVSQAEQGQTTPRFAAPGAILLAFGRCAELRESILRSMDYACMRLATGKAASPDFWMRELATAWSCLKGRVEPAREAGWRAHLQAVIPEQIYSQVRPDGTRLESLHNWTIYAAAGEVMREQAGLAPPDPEAIWGERFFDKYLPPQFGHFTAHGMYRDPGDPLTYDITTRLQIACALAFGYAGPHRADFDELLRRGGLTTLLFLSPDGYVPFGGRSAAYHFREAIIAALSELEASRYKLVDARLAGAFKRQAHRSVLAVQRWLQMEPLRNLKNGFDPQQRHGFDPYGHYSVYTLLTASFLGLAALFADDTIAEAPAPCELGGYALNLYPAFHKLCLSTRRSQAIIDTRAQLIHDATGLGRFTCAGRPLELGLGMPLTATPHYRLAPELLPRLHTAIGPEWQRLDGTWTSLAALSDELTPEVTLHEGTGPESVAATVTWRFETTLIRCRYTLDEAAIHLHAAVTIAGAPAPAIRLTIPILVTDGDAVAELTSAPGAHALRYRGSTLHVSYAANAGAELDESVTANRMAIYHTLRIATDTVTLRISD